jgi:hypothetical protein
LAIAAIDRNRIMAEKASHSAADATASKAPKLAGHSMPRGEARGQTAEGDIEQFLAAARAQKAGETLGRGQGKGP